MALRAPDIINHLRLKEKMAASDCEAVFSDGRVLPALIYKTGGQTKFTVELDNAFYEAVALPAFVRFTKKPVTAPIPEPNVQLVNEPTVKDDPVDISGQRLRLQLARNPDAIYKRNIIRQVFGSLEVREYLGVGQSDSTTRYWYCYCKAHGRYIVATQADLVTQTVTDCNNAREHTEKIEFRGARLP